MEGYIDDMLVKSKELFDHTKHLQEAFELLRRYDLKLNPFEMCFQSQFRQVFRLYGDPERDRDQCYLAQSYNGLSGSYLKKISAAIDWSVSSTWAVHIPFF